MCPSSDHRRDLWIGGTSSHRATVGIGIDPDGHRKGKGGLKKKYTARRGHRTRAPSTVGCGGSKQARMNCALELMVWERGGGYRAEGDLVDGDGGEGEAAAEGGAEVPEGPGAEAPVGRGARHQ